MHVAIVHDDMVQFGGAERVLEAVCELYPDAPIYTSVYDDSNSEIKKRFGSRKIVTSFIQKIPGWKFLYKVLLPLYPIAFEQFDFSKYDLVISHTTRFAKSIITKSGTKHICYMHTPPRFLWNFSGENQYKFLEPYFKWLRYYDKVSARRPDLIIAGSENAKQRIKDVYGIDSKVLYPFIDLKRFKEIETFDGGYFLVISRLNKYKRVDLAVDACIKLGFPLKVIGNGPEEQILKPFNRIQGKQVQDDVGGNKVEFLGNLSDEMVVKVLAGCKAIIIPGIEDFGLTSLEAQAMGKSVIAYKAGGALETVIDGKTGFFFDQHSFDSLAYVLRKFDPDFFSEYECIQNAKKFSKEIFLENFKQTISTL